MGDSQNMTRQANEIAEKATHCGMCKVNFLDIGLCPAGVRNGYVAYWPDGRMELYRALQEKRIIPTKKILDIVNSCNLCGICDRQCCFITNLRPTVVHKALKEYVAKLDPSKLKDTPEDTVFKELQDVVGNKWASNDPTILCAYTQTIHVGNSYTHLYVTMPKTAEEVAKIVQIANRHHLPYLPRGNGTFLSVGLKTMLAKPLGLQHGIIIDTGRMKTIKVDPEMKTAVVQAGINAYELQQAASAHGLRACLGEAEAYVCSNVASHGIISTWGNTYGWGADHFIDAQLVDNQGHIIRLSDPSIGNLYASPHGMKSLTITPSHITTELILKLHPILPDEHGMFIPFEHLEDAVDFATNLAQLRIGLSLVVLSSKYYSDFICPTEAIARDFEHVMRTHLKIQYIVDVIGDTCDRRYIEEHASVIIDESMMKTLFLSTPTLASLKDNPLLKAIQEEDDPARAVFAGPLKPLLIQALHPSPEQLAATYPADLQDFFTALYSRPEISDAVWLHANRILPSRMLRQHMFMIRGGFLKADKNLIIKSHAVLAAAGEKYDLDHALGFISFYDEGRIAFIEYDYYYDHTEPKVYERLNNAIAESLFGELSLDGFLPLEYVLHKGLHRKEHVFYPLQKGLSETELKQLQTMIQQILAG
jgi:hypothetical protein